MADDDRLGPYVRRLELALQGRHFDRARRIVDDCERTWHADAVTLDTLLSELDGLPIRVLGLLEHHGIRTVRDAVERKPDELMALPHVGVCSVQALVAAIVQALEPTE